VETNTNTNTDENPRRTALRVELLRLGQDTKRLLLYIAVIVVLTVAGVFITIFLLGQFHLYEYTSTSMVYITELRNETESATGVYQELLADKEIATDFSNFIMSEAGFAKVRDRLGGALPWVDEHVYAIDDDFITASNEAQSRLITIEVVCDNPYDAAVIANKCVDVLDELSLIVYAEDVVQVVQIAEPVTRPSFPDRKMLVPLGAGFGFFGGVVLVFLLWVFFGKRQS
jgi:capsular polysaccharide biosynthesis protein